jgi:DNA-binding response OmpR family regulator
MAGWGTQDAWKSFLEVPFEREGTRRGQAPQERTADGEPGCVLIATGEDRVGQVLSMMMAEEGQRALVKGWHDPDLMRIIGERFRMVLLDWGSAPTLAAQLADVLRVSQRAVPIAVVVPCWSDLEVGAREAADFLINKPLRVTQIRRVLSLACRPQSRSARGASQIPAGAA